MIREAQPRLRLFCNFARVVVFSPHHPTMKTPLFFIAALTAFFALPFDFVAMASVLFGAGLVAIIYADYQRPYRPLRSPARAAVPASVSERLRLAA